LYNFYLFLISPLNPDLWYVISFHFGPHFFEFFIPFTKVIFLFNFTFQSQIYSCPLIYFVFQFLYSSNYYFSWILLYNWFFFSISSCNVWFAQDWIFMIFSIVIKPGTGVDPTKGLGPGFHGSTHVNPEKFK